MFSYSFISNNKDFEKLAASQKRIAIYGTGEFATNILTKLSEHGLKIEGFIDYELDPSNKIGAIFCGYKVYNIIDAESVIDVVLIGHPDNELILRRLSKDIHFNKPVISIIDDTSGTDAKNNDDVYESDMFYVEDRFIISRKFAEQAILSEIEKFNIDTRIIEEIYEIVKPYTFCGRYSVYMTVLSVINAVRKNQKGVFLELGVYKGGSSLAALLTQKMLFGKVIIPVWMLDSFRYFSEATLEDGELYGIDPDLDKFYPPTGSDICYVNDVIKTVEFFGFKEGEYVVRQGWFEDTLSGVVEELKDVGISILRLDNDLYKSTQLCLDMMMPSVIDDGIVLIDDYHFYAGCALAIHEYLGQNKLSYRIYNINDLAYFYKTNASVLIEENLRLLEI